MHKNKILSFCSIFLILLATFYLNDFGSKHFDLPLKFNKNNDHYLIRQFVKDLREKDELYSLDDYYSKFLGGSTLSKHKLTIDGPINFLFLYHNFRTNKEYYLKKSILNLVAYEIIECINRVKTSPTVLIDCYEDYHFFLDADGVPLVGKIDKKDLRNYSQELLNWKTKLEKFIKQPAFYPWQQQSISKLGKIKKFLKLSNDQIIENNSNSPVHGAFNINSDLHIENLTWIETEIKKQAVAEFVLFDEIVWLFLKSLALSLIFLMVSQGIMGPFLSTSSQDIPPTGG